MLLGIDHLVVAVRDPDAAAADLEAALGLAATAGGRHLEAGTSNRLVFLGDTYVELIGIWDRSLARANPIGSAALDALDAGSPGLVTWAIATDSAAGDVAALQASGSSIGEARPGQRRRDDGRTVRWQVAFAPPLAIDRPPFLIEHELAGPEWSDAARRARAAYVHPFGGRARLVGLELAVHDPAEVAAALAGTVGLRFSPAAGPGPGDLEARLGEQAVRLVATAAGPASGPGVRRASVEQAREPAARLGILATAGTPTLVDLFGVRFARR